MAKYSHLTDEQIKERITHKQQELSALKKEKAIKTNPYDTSTTPDEKQQLLNYYNNEISKVEATIKELEGDFTNKNISKYIGENTPAYDKRNDSVSSLQSANQHLTSAIQALRKIDPNSVISLDGKTWVVNEQFKKAWKAKLPKEKFSINPWNHDRKAAETPEEQQAEDIYRLINTIEQFSEGGAKRKEIEKNLGPVSSAPTQMQVNEVIDTAMANAGSSPEEGIKSLQDTAANYYKSGCIEIARKNEKAALELLTAFNQIMASIKSLAATYNKPQYYTNAKVYVFTQMLSNSYAIGVLDDKTKDALRNYVAKNGSIYKG